MILFIGNDINNIQSNSNNSWEKLLKKIIEKYGRKIEVDKSKPFPLVYEELYLKLLKSGRLANEVELKSEIAKAVSSIKPNEIHKMLLELDCDNFVTTNYDYTLQQAVLKGKTYKILKNDGLVYEKKFSVFRHNTIGDKKFWHIHGEINTPQSINLGFEHYGGQLQHLRDYVVSGVKYKTKEAPILPLYKRLKDNEVKNISWVDYFYTEEVHIIGLSLGFEETDLWWLITNRARFKYEKKLEAFKNSRIVYYCPSLYKNDHKEQIMNANGIETVYIDKHSAEFYFEVINRIKNRN
jgi:hypothetical protein